MSASSINAKLFYCIGTYKTQQTSHSALIGWTRHFSEILKLWKGSRWRGETCRASLSKDCAVWPLSFLRGTREMITYGAVPHPSSDGSRWPGLLNPRLIKTPFGRGSASEEQSRDGIGLREVTGGLHVLWKLMWDSWKKFKGKGSRNGGLQNEGEGQLPDMIARIWGRSQTDRPGFFQDKNIPYTFAESNNVIEQCCNTEDLELKMSYFITLQWQRVALQGVTKPTRHWVLRRCTFSLHLASPGENWVPDRPWCSRWWACVWVLMSVTLLVLLLKWGLPILAAIHMPQRSGGGPRWRRLTPWHPEHVWGRRYCR